MNFPQACGLIGNQGNPRQLDTTGALGTETEAVVAAAAVVV